MKKGWIIAIGVVVVLIIAVALSVRPIVDSVIEKKLGDKLDVDYKHLSVNIFKRSATVRGVSLKTKDVKGLVFASAHIEQLAYRRDSIYLTGADLEIVPAEQPGNTTRIVVTGLTSTAVSLADIKRDTIRIDSIHIAAIGLTSAKDRNVDAPPMVKKMLWQTVQSIPIPLHVRRLAFDDFDIEYRETPAGGSTAGVVTLTDGVGGVSNLTNMVARAGADEQADASGHGRFFVIDLRTLLQHSGELVFKARFPVAPSDNHWDIAGQLGATDLTAFNRAVEPLMNARIDSGMVQGMNFNIVGNAVSSHIDMTMRYTDLEVALLKKNDHSQERGLLTFALDNILIRHSNPGANGKLRTGSGENTHDPQRSMYNFIWKSFIPGLKQTVI